MRHEIHNLDGLGQKQCQVYDLRPMSGEHPDYWKAVTNVGCPVCQAGIIRWAEAGYVSGYRICDGCERHFLAKGTAASPTLIRVGTRRGFPVQR